MSGGHRSAYGGSEGNVEVVPIIKRERDDLRKYNLKMRQILKQVTELASIYPVDTAKLAALGYASAVVLVEQDTAGFTPVWRELPPYEETNEELRNRIVKGK